VIVHDNIKHCNDDEIFEKCDGYAVITLLNGIDDICC
jgi:hypothetical protein